MSMKFLWQLRRKFEAQLRSVPFEKQAGLKAALRGIDMLMRATLARQSSSHSRP